MKVFQFSAEIKRKEKSTTPNFTLRFPKAARFGAGELISNLSHPKEVSGRIGKEKKKRLRLANMVWWLSIDL